MNEFANRIQAQRDTLKAVNNKFKMNEELVGLSEKAISRWIRVNNVDDKSTFVKTLTEVSSKLFFLANKSQEQISEVYKSLSLEVYTLIDKLNEQTV